MTGIEQLRKLGADAVRGGDIGRAICDIADQIERERECDADTIENLRLELGEARDAIAWVREHGGLDAVKELLGWVVGHRSTRQQLDFDFWLSGRVMHELGFDEDMADRDEVGRRLAARLMPEGMEWLVEAWPRFEDDVPVKLGDMALIDGYVDMVEAVQIWIHGKPVIYGDGGSQQLDKGERVKRPEPKVPDADGVEIRAKETVFDKNTGEELIVTGFEDGRVWCEHRMTDADALPVRGMWSPDQLTHQRPVIDAVGVEIRLGDTVYEVKTGDKFVVETIYSGMTEPDFPEHTVKCHKRSDITAHMFAPDMLTHRAPVLAADGKPLREGETVWDVLGNRRFKVLGFGSDAKLGEFTVKTAGIDGMSLEGYSKPSDLTHERPDSRERLEEDAEKDPCGYFGFDGEETCGKCPASGKNCEQTMARDIVRRARALAGDA